MVYSTLNSSLHSASLAVTVNQDHYLASVHNSANTNGESMSRNILGLATKETAVGNACIGGKSLHTGS